jgi:hypothetical protein
MYFWKYKVKFIGTCTVHSFILHTIKIGEIACIVNSFKIYTLKNIHMTRNCMHVNSLTVQNPLYIVNAVLADAEYNLG